MDRFSSGADWLLLVSAVVAALVPPAIEKNWRDAFRFYSHAPARMLFMLLFLAFGVLFGTGYLLELPLTRNFGVLYLPVALVLFFVLSSQLSGLHALTRGALLLLLGLFILPDSLGEPSERMALLAWLAGLIAGRMGEALLSRRTAWDDLTIPALFVIGRYWLGVTEANASWNGLLAVLMSIALLVRAFQAYPLPISCRLTRAGLFTLMAGLGAWLAIQTLLPQVDIRHWVSLFAGATLTGFLLARLTPEDAESDKAGRFIGLLLIGLLALVASRLYGTMGWLVAGLGLLVPVASNPSLAVALLFFATRMLLQGFLYQHNPNVTGINITHPYAGAALYGGFILMLMVPAWLAGLRKLDAPGSKPSWLGLSPAVVLITAAIPMAALGNYFLHAEAMGSWLVAAVVGGTGVALLYEDAREPAPDRPLWMTLPLWLITGGLLTADMLTLGADADKGAKISVLLVSLLVSATLLMLVQRALSRQAVEVS